MVPFTPGGPSDTTARLIAGPMAKALGQQIVIENATGAGGTIGTNRVAKAKPDGYTLMVSGTGPTRRPNSCKKTWHIARPISNRSA